MKKLSSLVLSLLLAGSLVACQGAGSGTKTTQSDVTEGQKISAKSESDSSEQRSEASASERQPSAELSETESKHSEGASTEEAASEAASSEAQNLSEHKDKSQGEQVVVFWHSLGGALGDELTKIVDEYNQGEGKDKGIRVEAVYQGYEGTDKQILAYQSKDLNNACDINVGLTSTIPSMLSLDWTVKVESLLADANSKVKKEDFYPALLRSVTYGDEVVALPFLNSTLEMYVNLDMLKEAGVDVPKTFDELIEIAPKLTKKQGDKVQQYAFESQVKRYQLVNFSVSQKKDAFFGDQEGGRKAPMTKITAGEDGTLKNFLTKLETLNKTGGYLYQENKAAEEFAAKKTAMVLMSSSKVGAVNDLVGSSFKWQTVPMPKVNAADESGAAVGGSCLVLFNRGDENRVKAAWDFMSYLSKADIQSRIAQKSGYIPTNVAAENEAEMKKFYEENPNFKTALEIVKNSDPNTQEPMDLCYSEIDKLITNVMLDFCNGKTDVDVTVQAIVDGCNRLLDDWHLAND